MEKYFNTAGSVDRKKHYCLPLEERLDPEEIPSLIKQEGVEQTVRYMDRSGADEGYLVVFDKRAGKSWEEKIYHEVVEYEEKEMGVWGM